MQEELLMPQECHTSLGQGKMVPRALGDSIACLPQPCCQLVPGCQDPEQSCALLTAPVATVGMISQGKLTVSVVVWQGSHPRLLKDREVPLGYCCLHPAR